MPIDGVATINSKPSNKKHPWPKPPFTLKDDIHAPRCEEVGKDGHNKADGDIPVWCLIDVGTQNQQCDANRKGNELPWAGELNQAQNASPARPWVDVALMRQFLCQLISLSIPSGLSITPNSKFLPKLLLQVNTLKK